MSQKKQTADERFLLQVYKMAMAKGDMHHPISIAAAAKAIGQKETAIKNIVKHLAQSNLVKKVGDAEVSLTNRGYQVISPALD